jgi:hypothetical protein
MIVFQSVACANKESSPKGCGRLAGNNIPGHQPNDPCALKGRWRKPPKPGISVFISVSLRLCGKKSVFIGVHPWFKTELNPFKRF